MYSGGIIRCNPGADPKIGVSIRDVQLALGTSQHFLHELCTHQNINKWAKYKPLRVSGELDVISENQRKAVKYGLVPERNRYAEAVIDISTSERPTQSQFNEAKEHALEWGYNKPRGRGNGYNEPFRLTDYVESQKAGEGGGSNGGFTNMGYYVNTPPPLDFGGEWNVSFETLTKVMNTSVSTQGEHLDAKWDDQTVRGYDVNGNQVSVETRVLYIEGSDRNSLLEYTGWTATFGTASSIANAGGYTIPLNFLLDVCANNEDWRLGLIVFIPGNDGNVRPHDFADVVLSRWPLMTLNSINPADYINRFSPDLATNQVCACRMHDLAQNNNETVFSCIPVICKVTNPASVLYRTDYQRTIVSPSNTNWFEIYSIPTGYCDFKIRVSKADYSYGWKFVAIPVREVDMRTGGDITSSTPSIARAWVRNLYLYREEMPYRDYQVTQVSCSYSYRVWDATTQAPKVQNGTYTRTNPLLRTDQDLLSVGSGYGYMIHGGYDTSFYGATIILHT